MKRAAWLLAGAAALALAIPAGLAVIWHLLTTGRPYSLIPPPAEVWTALVDLAVGGINDDAFSATLLTHLGASLSRVYGGFALAVLFALPLGLLIGRVPLMRQLLDPTFQILRPVPVTAWLPLAMILFGLGPRSARRARERMACCCRVQPASRPSRPSRCSSTTTTTTATPRAPPRRRPVVKPW